MQRKLIPFILPKDPVEIKEVSEKTFRTEVSKYIKEGYQVEVMNTSFRKSKAFGVTTSYYARMELAQ